MPFIGNPTIYAVVTPAATDTVPLIKGGALKQATVGSLALGAGSPALRYTIDVVSTADSDPGVGKLRFNHATQASATVLFVDNATNDTVSVATFFAALPPSGWLLLAQADDATAWHLYRYTALVDGTGYRKFTVASQAAGGSFDDETTCLLSIMPGGGDALKSLTLAQFAATSSAELRTLLSDETGTGAAVFATSPTLVTPALGTPSAVVLTNGTGLPLTTGVTGVLPVANFATGTPDGTKFVRDDGVLATPPGGGSSDSFKTISVSGQSDVVADSSTDTLTLVAGTNVTITTNAGTDTITITASGGGGSTQGKHGMWIGAGAMRPSIVAGCAPLARLNVVDAQPNIETLDFDPTTEESAQFSLRPPKKWNAGTVTFVPVWSHAATTTNFGVVWTLQALAVSDDDAIEFGYGIGQSSTDTGGTTDDNYISPESSAITIAGTPAKGDVLHFKILRTVADGGDTLAIDARLHGIEVFFTTDADTDA